MAFYQPEIFTNRTEMEIVKSQRILQPVWDFIKNGREDTLRSPIFPPMMALAFDYSYVLIFTMIDLFLSEWSYFKKHKLQKDRKVTWGLTKKSLMLQMWNHLLIVYPISLVQIIWVPPTPLPEVAPTLWDFVSQQILWIFMFDFSYFAFHYMCHRVRFLYRWCHSVHHMYSSPFAAAAQHLHPFELIYVSVIATMIPWPFKPHCMTYWSWFLVSQYISYEVHCGYDFPWAANNFIPIYGGAPAHDLHHMRPMTNFEPWLVYLDKIFGFYLDHEKLAKLKGEKAKHYGLYAKEDEEGLEKIN